MYERSEPFLKWLWLLAVIMIGCVPPGDPTETASSSEAGPATPTEPAPVANLETVETTVWRIRGDDIEVIEKDRPAPIVANDQISLEKQARGLLRFEDDLVVELFRNTEVELSDARLDPQGFLFLGLRQIAGSTRAELNARRDARLQIETELATATISSADGSDAEVVVCHKPERVTCLVTVKGVMEVASPGKTVTVEAGEATYVFNDRPLSDPICVVQADFQMWLARERNAQENEPLGAVVSGWPQRGCESATEEPPAPTATPLPAGQGMVHVDGGLYEVGLRQPDANHVAAREVEVTPFWIDAYEVTNGQYAAFVRATGHTPPAGWPYAEERVNHPVKGVSWHDAQAYCSYLGKRLPTEAEWEVAGRGHGDPPPIFPWGDDPLAGGQIDQLPQVDTHSVGSAPFTASPFGVYDMSANVREWVGEPYAPIAADMRILRGGRHGFQHDLAYREIAPPADPSFLPVAGIRCAADRVVGE